MSVKDELYIVDMMRWKIVELKSCVAEEVWGIVNDLLGPDIQIRALHGVEDEIAPALWGDGRNGLHAIIFTQLLFNTEGLTPESWVWGQLAGGK